MIERKYRIWNEGESPSDEYETHVARRAHFAEPHLRDYAERRAKQDIELMLQDNMPKSSCYRYIIESEDGSRRLVVVYADVSVTAQVEDVTVVQEAKK